MAASCSFSLCSSSPPTFSSHIAFPRNAAPKPSSQITPFGKSELFSTNLPAAESSPELRPVNSRQVTPICKAGVRCEASEGNETIVNRRDLVVGMSAAAVAAGVWSLSPATEEAQAADLIQRGQRAAFSSSLKDKLRDELKVKPELVPGLLRLSLNDAMTYDKASKTGGANGSVRAELSRQENQGLEKEMSFLEDLKKTVDDSAKGGPISWSDLIHLAAQSAVKRTFIEAAIRKCGGNEQKGFQLYTAYGSTGQWGQFDKLLGRFDVSEPDPEGRVLVWEKASVAEIKEKFGALGFKPRQIAVLSAFLGPSQAETEAKLAADPEFVPWVKKYQNSRETVSQTDYEVDLITAFTRLSGLGQTINTEAYTYATPKMTLRF